MARTYHCNLCGRDMPAPGICSKCVADMDKPIRLPEPRVEPRMPLETARPGLHVAGPVVDGLIRCSRCGALLGSTRRVGGEDGPRPATWSIPELFFAWPEGTLIERGLGWQAEYLGNRQPNCETGDVNGKSTSTARSAGTTRREGARGGRRDGARRAPRR